MATRISPARGCIHGLCGVCCHVQDQDQNQKEQIVLIIANAKEYSSATPVSRVYGIDTQVKSLDSAFYNSQYNYRAPRNFCLLMLSTGRWTDNALSRFYMEMKGIRPPSEGAHFPPQSHNITCKFEKPWILLSFDSKTIFFNFHLAHAHTYVPIS